MEYDCDARTIFGGAFVGLFLAGAALPKIEPVLLTPGQAALGASAYDGQRVSIRGQVTVGTNFAHLKNHDGEDRLWMPWIVSDGKHSVTIYMHTANQTEQSLPANALTDIFHAGKTLRYPGVVVSSREGRWFTDTPFQEGGASPEEVGLEFPYDTLVQVNPSASIKK